MAEWSWLWRVSLMVVVALVVITPKTPAHRGQEKKILAEKVRQLTYWTKKNRVIRMNDIMFNHFVLETPRNYSVIVMLTALQKFRACLTCEHAAEEFQILADSWQGSRAFSNKVFFALVDFDESPDIFQMLQLMSVPNVLHFSAKRKFTPDDIYHLAERGITAQQMSKWVAERTKRRVVNTRTRQPTDYYYPFKLGISLALIGGLVYVLKWKRKFIFNTHLWAVLALGFVIPMISGHMWTHITEAPFAQSDTHTGRTYYIHEVSYFQLAAEMYIVSLFHVCMTLGMVLLDTAATSRMMVMKRKIISVSSICLFVIFFSWLLSLFRFKEPNYPFRILMD
uniref:Magnesium transporter protein 1 n=2 Tax=Sus scrofa TaxID=9823 RepID=A0A8D1FI87_PIG